MKKKILIGKKIGMTQLYDEGGKLVPITVLKAGPCWITQLKRKETEGYNAVQIGFDEQKDHRLTQPVKGHLNKAGVKGLRILKEFLEEEVDRYKVGDSMTVSLFSPGQKVDVIGTVKGRGFQGTVKRHGFAGQPDSHGHMMHRRPGSIGMCQTPGHVYKGRKMPGHMGSVRRTIQNLVVFKVIEEKNLLLIQGSFPGARNSTVYIREAVKQKH